MQRRIQLDAIHRCAGFLLVVWTALGCVQAKVHVDSFVTPGADLMSVQTYALVPPPWPHPIVGERIESEIRGVLEAKGIRERPLDQADIAVSFRATQQRRQRVRSVVDPDTMTYRVQEGYIEKTVEIDVFDATSREVLWRGIGRIDVVTDPALPTAAAKSVREILREFPPES